MIFGEVSDDLRPQYQALRKCGLHLTTEILRTGHVSTCIEDRERGDFDTVITPNDATVVPKVEEMIRRFDESAYREWVKNYDEI
jgi:hypothetical protein